MDEQTWTGQSRLFNVARFDFERKQTASVLLTFSCRRRDMHHELMSFAQVDKRLRSELLYSSRSTAIVELSVVSVQNVTAQHAVRTAHMNVLIITGYIIVIHNSLQPRRVLIIFSVIIQTVIQFRCCLTGGEPSMSLRLGCPIKTKLF